MYSPLLIIILAVVAFYVVVGIWRYLRQELQPRRRDGRRKGGG